MNKAYELSSSENLGVKEWAKAGMISKKKSVYKSSSGIIFEHANSVIITKYFKSNINASR